MNEMIHEAGDRRGFCWGIAPVPNNLSTLACANCDHTMELVRTISKLGVLPELLVFHCHNCSSSTVLTAMTLRQRRCIRVRQHERNPMSFRFFVGQAVEYTPIGEKTAGLYKIMRQMPTEEQAFDLKYCIKSEAEAYERNVLECQLSSDVRPKSEYATTMPRLSQGSHRT
jgi:hypothetical protein